jgi:hypothetical protein
VPRTVYLGTVVEAACSCCRGLAALQHLVLQSSLTCICSCILIEISPRFYPCGDVNCAASAPRSSPRYTCCSSRLCPSLVCCATVHPFEEACVRIPTLQPSINGKTPSFRLHCSPPLPYTTGSGTLHVTGFIAAEHPIYTSRSPIIPRTAAVHRWRGPLMRGKPPLYFWRLFLRSLP